MPPSLPAARCRSERRAASPSVPRLSRVDVAGFLDAARASQNADQLQRLRLAQVADEALDAFGDEVDVSGADFGAILACAHLAAAADDVIELFAVVEAVPVMHVAGRERLPVEGIRAAVVAADGQAELGDIPTRFRLQRERLHILDVDEDAFAEALAARHLEVGLRHVAAEFVSRIGDALRADVETDDEPVLVFRLV